jgi:hypothetical protein
MRNSEWFQAMETSLYMEKCGDSQRKRKEDCVVLAHHAYPGFYTSLGGDTEDSRMKVPVGGDDNHVLILTPRGVYLT